MNLHPDIQTLLNEYTERKSISLDEKQYILKKAIELDQDLKFLIKALDNIENNSINQTTEITKCAACGEIIPALDRVCPSCKNVKTTKGTIEIKLDDLIFESELILSDLKSLDTISFTKRLLKNSSITFPLFIAASFILGWNFNSNVLAGVFFCGLFLWLLVIRRLKRNLLQVQSSQNRTSFQLLVPQLENKIRLLELYFGNDTKTKDHANQLKQELMQLKNRKNKLVIFETLIYMASFILLLIVGYFTQI